MLISTHAPVRGRSYVRDTIGEKPTEFLLTPPCGGDPSWSGILIAPTFTFLLTPPCGGDRAADWRFILAKRYFYSRPRAGAIKVTALAVSANAVFLLTPPCGGDLFSSGTSALV